MRCILNFALSKYVEEFWKNGAIGIPTYFSMQTKTKALQKCIIIIAYSESWSVFF